ncbi:MAG TPA: hypothetical protein VK841_05300 [Polyangiaceae bacterium]|jgi:hypothetical protein|nr:hypothetical protein [Polyangiaceae bacterium]
MSVQRGRCPYCHGPVAYDDELEIIGHRYPLCESFVRAMNGRAPVGSVSDEHMVALTGAPLKEMLN